MSEAIAQVKAIQNNKAAIRKLISQELTDYESASYHGFRPRNSYHAIAPTYQAKSTFYNEVVENGGI